MKNIWEEKLTANLSAQIIVTQRGTRAHKSRIYHILLCLAKNESRLSVQCVIIHKGISGKCRQVFRNHPNNRVVQFVWVRLEMRSTAYVPKYQQVFVKSDPIYMPNWCWVTLQTPKGNWESMSSVCVCVNEACNALAATEHNPEDRWTHWAEIHFYKNSNWPIVQCAVWVSDS